MAHIIIIGAGAVGLCSAYYLHEAGWEVTVVDKGDLSDNCSFGNAGMIVPSHFVPLAAPGVVKQGIRWLFNGASPLQLKPSLDPEWFRWAGRFIGSANSRHVMRSKTPLRDISLLSKSLFESLATQLQVDVHHKGVMLLSMTEQSADKQYLMASEARKLGLDVVNLSREEAIRKQGGLPLNVAGAVHYRCDSHLDPGHFMVNLTHYLSNAGVRILRNHEVTRLVSHGGRITKVLVESGEVLSADAYVLAAGSWSAKIARSLHMNITLMPGRGYSFLADSIDPQQSLQIPSLLSEAKVAITPMRGGLRFGGTMELGKMGAPVNMQRVKGIVQSVNQYFPTFNLQMPSAQSIWSGYRPCSGDGLPYIGFHKHASNLALATGHGMMGVSLGPATGLLVTELLQGKTLSMDIDPFSPNR